MQQSTICMIRISRQQQGEMFSNTIFITFNNQHRHCNIVHRWMQGYKNMQHSVTVLVVHCSSEYNHITRPQPPIYNTEHLQFQLKTMQLATCKYNWEMQYMIHIIQQSTPMFESHLQRIVSWDINHRVTVYTKTNCYCQQKVIWALGWESSYTTRCFDIIYYTGVIICDAMHCFFFKLIQTEVQLAIILRQIQNELETLYVYEMVPTPKETKRNCYYQTMTTVPAS